MGAPVSQQQAWAEFQHLHGQSWYGISQQPVSHPTPASCKGDDHESHAGLLLAEVICNSSGKQC